MGPCLNPNCASNGSPHPNCRCYSNMAKGGEVSYFCQHKQPHESNCEYFMAEGGTPSFDPDAFLAERSSLDIPKQSNFNPDQFLAEPVNAESEADARYSAHQELQSKYGTPSQQAIAGVEAVSKGLAGPLATGAERLMGINSEGIRGREEANPVTHLIGEVAGLVSPIGQGALLGKTGSLAVASIEKFVPKLVEKGILAGVAKSAVKLAAENALYQASDETSKMLVNDPNQSVSSAISNIGLAAAIGTMGGGILGSISPLWKASLGGKASKLIEDFKTRMKEHLELPAENVVHTISPTFKEVFDPFTKEIKTIESVLPDNIPRSNFDPFTKKEMLTAEPVKEVKPIESTPGGKLADMFIKHADSISAKTLSGTVGAALGHATGIPYGGTIGAILGERALSPIIESILPAISKPMIEKMVSSEGLKSATDYGLMVIRGNKIAGDAVKALLKPGVQVIKDNYRPDQESRKKLEANLLRIQQDPTQITTIGGSVGHYFPDHAVALGSVASNVTNFLNTLRPIQQPKAPLDPPVPQSKVIKSEYDRALDIAEQPLVVLDSIKENTITSHDVLALQKMYPDLYRGLQQKVMNQIVEHVAKGETIPYKTRLGLSVFMGQPLDSTMNSTSIAAAQPSLQQPQSNQSIQNQSKKMTQSAGNQLVRGSKSMQTSIQASEAMHSTGKA